MIERFDPNPIITAIQKLKGPLSLPREGEGVLVLRERGQDEVQVAIGSASSGSYLLFNAKTARHSTLKEISISEYRQLLAAIDKQEFRACGAVAEADILDGESYRALHLTSRNNQRLPGKPAIDPGQDR